MNSRMKLLSLILFGPFLLLNSCGGSSTGGTEVGNTRPVTLKVIGYQSSKVSALTIGSLEVTTAKIVLDRLRFRPFKVCQGGTESNEIRFDGPFVVHLVENGVVANVVENLGASHIDNDADDDGVEDSEDTDDDNDGTPDSEDADDDGDGVSDDDEDDEDDDSDEENGS